MAELLDDLERIRADVAGMTRLNDAIIAEYAHSEAPFQRHAHIRTLVVDYFTQFLATTEESVERTITEVHRWDDLSPAGDKAVPPRADRPRAPWHRHRRRPVPRALLPRRFRPG